MRPIAFVLAVCGIALTGIEAAQPTFRSGVELVTIDVVATGRDGGPVHDLKATDFELFEDGASQPIRAFQFINFSSSPAPTALPPGVVSNDVEPAGLFVLVLDDIGYYATESREVRMAAERFLKGALQPDDQIAVIRSGAQSGFFLTSDHALALDAALSTFGRRDRGMRLERAGAPDALGAGDFDTGSPGETGLESFKVLAATVEKLRPIAARRKAVIWFSRGGELPANWETNFEIGQPVGRNEQALAQLINSARLANVAIYTVDPRGLVAPSTSGRDNPGTPDFEEIGTHRDLAVATGGRPIVNTNDIDAALRRVGVENRAYYLIGYEPAPAENPKKPRARKIKVTTKAPGVELLHRTTYFPGAGGAANVSLIESPLVKSDLRITLAPAVVAMDKKKRGILLPFEVGVDLRDGTEVTYNAIALDNAGKVVSRANGKGQASGGRVIGEVGLAVQSETYQIRFAASTSNPQVDGLAFATVKVPDGSSKDPECAGFVFEQPGPRARVRQFTRDQPMTISTFISAEKLNGAISFGLGAAGGVPQRLFPATLGQPLANGLWRVALGLKAPLPAGDLEVRIMKDDLLLADNCIAQFVSK